MQIFVGADHAGCRTKDDISRELGRRGFCICDMGTLITEPVDYPYYAIRVAKNVATCSSTLGILICGTGNGMAMAANKISGIRAAVCRSVFEARMAREHNHANILCLGARVDNRDSILDIVNAFLSTAPSDDERHLRRIGIISEYETQGR